MSSYILVHRKDVDKRWWNDLVSHILKHSFRISEIHRHIIANAAINIEIGDRTNIYRVLIERNAKNSIIENILERKHVI